MNKWFEKKSGPAKRNDKTNLIDQINCFEKHPAHQSNYYNLIELRKFRNTTK
jgi:hypothetical protein